MHVTRPLILASGSPRRSELLERAGYEFEVIVSDADELEDGALAPAELAMHNARAKALAVAHEADGGTTVIGADTIVVLDGRVFGKPSDATEAARMLHALSGRTHQVITGVCIARTQSAPPAQGPRFTRPAGRLEGVPCASVRVHEFAEVTDVTFRKLSDEEIAAYVASGEPLDKAGAYGIQGLGGALVDHIDGDYDNVVGLPVTRLQRALDLERGKAK